MNEQSLDLIISKVEKLWRKAGDPAATDAEREAFESKALQLMAEHRISEAMLDLGYEDVLGDWDAARLNGRDALLTIELLDTIARAFDCRVYWTSYGLSYNVKMFGFKSDYNRVMPLFTLLLSDSTAQAAKLKGRDMADTKALRRGFRQGYRSAICTRLTQSKSEAVEAAKRRAALTALFGEEVDDDLDWSDYEDEIAAAAAQDTTVASAALVLVEKGKRVESEFTKRRVHRVGSAAGGAYSAYGAGRAAGERANLNPSRGGVGASRKALT